MQQKLPMRHLMPDWHTEFSGCQQKSHSSWMELKHLKDNFISLISISMIISALSLYLILIKICTLLAKNIEDLMISNINI